MDHIKNLLSQTGWSYDELLQKLNEFKNSPPVDAESSSSEAQRQPERSQQECNAGSSSTDNAHHRLNHKEESESQQVFKNCFQCHVDSSSTLAQNEGLIQCNKIESDKENESQAELKEFSSNNVNADASLNKEERNENEQEFEKCSSESQQVFKSSLPCDVDSNLTPSRNDERNKGPRGFLQQCNQTESDKDNERQTELKECSSNDVKVDASLNKEERNENEHEFEKCSSESQHVFKSNLPRDVDSNLTPSHDDERNEDPRGFLQRCNQTESDKDNERQAELKECSSNNVNVDVSSNKNEQEFEKCNLNSSSRPVQLSKIEEEDEDKSQQDFEKCKVTLNSAENHDAKDCDELEIPCEDSSSTELSNKKEQKEDQLEFKKPPPANLNFSLRQEERLQPNNNDEEDKSREDFEKCKVSLSSRETHDSEECELNIPCENSSSTERSSKEQQIDDQACNLKSSSRKDEHRQSNGEEEEDESQTDFKKRKANLNSVETRSAKECELKTPCDNENTSSAEQSNKEVQNGNQREIKKYPPSNLNSSSRLEENHQSNHEGGKDDESRQDFEECEVNLNTVDTRDVEERELTMPCNNKINSSSTEQSCKEKQDENRQECKKGPPCNLDSSSTQEGLHQPNNEMEEDESQGVFGKKKVHLNNSTETHNACELKMPTEKSNKEEQIEGRTQFKERSPFKLLNSSSRQEEHRQSSSEGGKDESQRDFEKCEVNLDSAETRDVKEWELTVPCNNKNANSTEEELEQCPPCNFNSGSRQDDPQPKNEEKEEDFEKCKTNLNSVESRDVQEVELAMPNNNKNLNPAEQSSKEEDQQELKQRPPCNLNSSLRQEEHRQLNCGKESESQQNFKKHNANLNSTEINNAERDCEFKMPGNNKDASSTEQSSKEEQIDGQQEFKKWPVCNLNLNCSREEEQHQSSKEGEKDESRQDFEKRKVNLSSAETRDAKEFKFTVPCNNVKTSSTEPSSKEEQNENENQQELKKCHNLNSSSREADESCGEGEEKSRQDFEAKLNSTETHDATEEHAFKVPCINKNTCSLAQGVKKCKPKNKEVDASDHNYIKKDCEQNNYFIKLPPEKSVVKTKSAKVTNFRSRFLYRIKRSYRLRGRHKNVKRSQLIPRQSRRNTEGVRNQILQQLELLRNRRPPDFGRDLHQTIAPGLAEPLLYKKRLSNEKAKNESTASSSATTNQRVEEAAVNEFMTEQQEPNSNEDFYTIKPTKTKDITKIKGWKHKKFASLDLSAAAKNCGSSFVTVKSTLSCSFEEDNKINECEKQEEVSESATSAFASNNLDGFLYESADLQISFQIPKLASGEDCHGSAPSAAAVASAVIKPQTQSEPEEEEDQDQDENVESSIINGDRENLLKIHKITNLYKPRTVAQRKRIWRLKNDARVKQDESSMRKPRTLAEKRRLMDVGGEDSKYFPPVKRSASETNFFGEDLKYSYVLFRGKKLRVPTPTEKGIIAYIKYSYNKREYIYVPKKRRKVSLNKNKPSIFNINSAVKSNAIKYRPGPLCKKLELQEYNKTWRTVIKKLPKVYLEVTPELNKPIHPGLLHLLPDYQFELTPSRVEFALSALYEKRVTFKFPLAYANHEESLLFREKIAPEDVKPSPPQDSEMLMTDVIKDVVNKMLDYVETKDLADEIFIKEDVVNVRCRDEEVSVSAPTKTKPKRKKKSKTNYELKRLNVKVIEVDLEDKGGDIVNCNKEYCKLGCVCKSLATTSSLVSNHCGIPDCMFECTCNYDRKSRGNLKITLPVGIDVLSEGAVSRLEDEAKKNLARFEKEFTQTVIQANNQTIVVGGHCNRQRRLTKAPRKYNDFIDDPDLLLENENEVEETPEPVEEAQPEIEWRPCCVKLPRLKLEQLIPFCLVHNLHNCHCGYKAQFKVIPPPPTENKLLFKRILESKAQNTSEECVPKSSSSSLSLSSLNPESSQTSARTRGISTSYYLVRNRTREFMWTRKKKLERLYNEYLDRLSLTEPVDFYVHSEVELSKLKEKDENIEVEDNKQQVSRSTRRKQQLTVREDTINLQAAAKKSEQQKKKKKQQLMVEKARQKLIKLKQAAKPEEKKSIPPEPKEQVEVVIAEPPQPPPPPVKTITPQPTPSELNNVVRDDTLPKFENLLLSSKHTTELLTPSSAVREKFLQLLGKKNESDAQFRLMPWSGLASRYETDQLQLWYSSYYKVPKIIVSDCIVAPKHFINVKQFENIQDKSLIKVDLIRWLVMKTVPGGKCSDDVLVILQLTKTHCEVCGICEKSQSTENMLLALIPSFLTQNKGGKESTETIEVNNLFNLETADDQKKQHVIAKKIKFSKCKYPEVTLQELEGPDSFLATQQNTVKWFITTHLPNINKNSQWRMVQLNSDFSVLSLLRNSYAIKYSDLLRIVRMSQATYTTIVLKTPEVEQNYPHPDFGIYAAPNCEEKIFIGPYFYYESHDVSTLRYVNRVLVKTELFNQMKGKAPTNNGCWLKQVQEGQKAQKKSLQTIDLTLCDSDNETEFIETQTQDVRVKYTPSPRSLLKNPLNANSDKEQQEISVVTTKVPAETPREEPSASEKSIFTIDDVANFEMSAVDFEVKDSSGDCVLEEDNAVNVRSFENQLYLVPNVPLMGYILAHKLRTITIVRWPTLNNAKRFYRIEEAVMWLEKELSDYFIVPPNFRIKIRVKTELTPRVTEPFDPKYLKGYYLATKYGVKSLLNVNVQTLKLLEVTSKELELLARRRAKKMIYDKCCDIAKQFIPSETLKAKSCSEVIDMITSEIKMQRRAETFYIDKQQKLLTKKEKLVDSLSSVIKDISPFVSNKTQSAMLDILKRHKVPPQSPTEEKPPPEKDSDVVCITIDSDDEASADSIEEVPPPKPVETPPPVIPKITVRNLHDLRDPNLSKPPDLRDMRDTNLSKPLPDLRDLRDPNLSKPLPPDNGNTVIVTKRKRSDVLKALRLNTASSNSISFDTKFEKIHLFPFTNPTVNNLTPDSSPGVKENSVAAPPTNMSEDIVTVTQDSKGVKRKLKPAIFPTISKCIIKTPTGKLIRVNAEQLKSIQNKGIILTPVTKEVKPPEKGLTVFTNHSSHGGFVKLNLDDAISTKILRKVSDTNNVQPSGSS